MEDASNNVHVQVRNEIQVKVEAEDALRRYCSGENNNNNSNSNHQYRSFMITDEELQTIKEEYLDENGQLTSNDFFNFK